ncbi:MAG: toxin-antitoxin system HicB family antitoxin [Cyanobacteria bacterium P01_F01_bin.143]
MIEKTKRPLEYDWDGFTINLYFDEDGEWLAHLVELPNISAFADTPELALDELYIAWEGMKECYHEDGVEIPVAPARREYSGQFNVRIDKRIHRNLVLEATKAGISLNALVSQKLARDYLN